MVHKDFHGLRFRVQFLAEHFRWPLSTARLHYQYSQLSFNALRGQRPVEYDEERLLHRTSATSELSLGIRLFRLECGLCLPSRARLHLARLSDRPCCHSGQLLKLLAHG